MINIRTGFGYDIHQLVEGREFWLGGVKLEHYKGALGHSDADVLIHAICDALLGAANLRDIGYHFPDTDPLYKGADSRILLTQVCTILREKGYEIGNIDSTVVLELPKVNPHVDKMKDSLAKSMSISIDQISIKATTSEKMSFVGKEEGVKAYSSVLIYKP
jgi:2-C-methyl-D-erythritol 2,4-cyclodiphosphate synthase